MLSEFNSINNSLTEDLLEEAKTVFESQLLDSKSRSLEVADSIFRNCHRCCTK